MRRRILGLLLAFLGLAAGSPGYGQAPNGNGLEVMPIETRAWAHEGYGRLVFDWPQAVAYGAQMEGTTLTVMFDRRLHTTFGQVPRYLGAYISDITLGSDRQSVVATLTDEYRLRTFLLNSEDGGVKVVVDLLADGEAGPFDSAGATLRANEVPPVLSVAPEGQSRSTDPVLAQAPTPPPLAPEPSPEAVPGDSPSPPISGDSPSPPTPALPFAVGPSLLGEGEGENPPRPFAKLRTTPPGRGSEDISPLGRGAAEQRGGLADAPSSAVAANGEPTSDPSVDRMTVPSSEMVVEPAGADPPRPVGPPPSTGSGQALQGGDEEEARLSGGAEEPPLLGGVPRQRRGGSTPAQSLTPDPSGEQTTGQNVDQTATPALGMATEPAGEEPTPPGGGAEISPSVKTDADTPPAEPDSSPESVPTAEATPPVETTAAPEQVTEPAPEAAPPAETAAASETASESSPPRRPVLSPAEGGAAEQRGGSTDAPPSLDPNEEQLAEQNADQAVAPPLETATEPAGANPPRPSATPPERGSEISPPERGSEEAPPAVKADADVPPTEPTPETVSEETPPVTTDPNPESPTPDQAGHPQGGAPTPDPNPQFPTLPASVRIPVSQSRLFRLDTPAASVFVADPAVADVQLVSSGVLFVVAKAVGRTSVAVLDADSALIGEWTINSVLDIQPVRAALEGVPALSNVTVRQLNRGAELGGTVASIAEADLALRLTVTALPEETPVENRIRVTGKQQVNLEVQIAEVQRSVSESLGFNWEVMPDIGGGRALGLQVGRFFFDEALGGFLVQELAEGRAASLSGSTGVADGRVTVRGMIDALASAGLATVLARPNVTAVSGETASFFSGGEYPLPSGFEDGAIIFEYKKYGVLLDFVPTIIDSGRIMLTVRPEVSQRSDTDSLTVTGIDIPVINVRRAETTVEVGDGESIVIAGLYRDQSEAIETGLPVVKDIPLLGMLFGSQSVRSSATELIVVVTARLTTATTMPRTTDRNRQLPGRRVRGYHY